MKTKSRLNLFCGRNVRSVAKFALGRILRSVEQYSGQNSRRTKIDGRRSLADLISNLTETWSGCQRVSSLSEANRQLKPYTRATLQKANYSKNYGISKIRLHPYLFLF